ncbi:MAG: low-complexity tail membrane protein [Microcoleaceae cyanobacterium]
MESFRFEPFLWIHFAGLLTLPLWLGLFVVGLGIGTPILPFWLELGLVTIIGIAPILSMQWYRPFYIFSILLVAMKPKTLTLMQRQILSCFNTKLNHLLSLITTILLIAILSQANRISFIVSDIVNIFPQSHAIGLLLATVGCLGCSLFCQVPASVLGVLLTKTEDFINTQPLDEVEIRDKFSIFGWQVQQIIPISSPKP